MDKATPSNRPADVFGPVSRVVVQAAAEGVVTVDEQQRIAMINPAALRMFGRSAEDLLGQPLTCLLPQRFREAHAEHLRRFDRSGAVELPMSRRSRVTGLRADGQEFPLEVSISRVAIQGEQGARTYFTALMRDLTVEQGMQAEIDALNLRMRDIFELAPVAIWITDNDHIVFANPACATLAGAASAQQLVGRSIYTLLDPASHRPMREAVARALASSEPVPSCREHIVRLDGQRRKVDIAVAGLPGHGREVVQMVISDITEQDGERELLERSRRDLRKLSASLVNAREDERRHLARELHDELGQRLTALKMELSSLATHLAPGVAPSRLAGLIEMVDDTVASMRRIATELRPLMLDDLGLNAAIEWLARDSSRRLGIPVELRLGDEDPPVGGAATIALYRMVQEALTNIARHAHASWASVAIERVDGELVLTVQDNGSGIPEGAVNRDGSHGLLGIRERAHMLGGQLEVGQRPGGGGQMVVRLPLATGSRLDPPSLHGELR